MGIVKHGSSRVYRWSVSKLPGYFQSRTTQAIIRSIPPLLALIYDDDEGETQAQ